MTDPNEQRDQAESARPIPEQSYPPKRNDPDPAAREVPERPFKPEVSGQEGAAAGSSVNRPPAEGGPPPPPVVPAAPDATGMPQPPPPRPKRTSEQIRADIDAQRAELGRSVDELRGRVTELTDWRGQLRKHRKQIIIGAVATGFIVGGLAALRRR